MADDARQTAEIDLIADLRARLAEGSCLCSSAHTDWVGVEALLDRLERAEAGLAAVEEVAARYAAYPVGATAYPPAVARHIRDAAATNHVPVDVVAFDGIPFIRCSCGKNPTPRVWLDEHWPGDRAEGESLGQQALKDAQQREREATT